MSVKNKHNQPQVKINSYYKKDLVVKNVTKFTGNTSTAGFEVTTRDS